MWFGFVVLFVFFRSGFEADPKISKFEVTGKTKKLSFIGKYTLNGQVLVLPIAGNGFANLTFGLYIKTKLFNEFFFISKIEM